MYKLSNTFETGISDHQKLISTVARLESNSYSEFEKAFLTVLNNQAPLKIKFLRHNSNPFKTKGLPKAIMERSTKTEITKTGIYIKTKEFLCKPSKEN